MKKKILFMLATPFFFIMIFLAIWATEGIKESFKQCWQFVKDYDISEIDSF